MEPVDSMDPSDPHPNAPTTPDGYAATLEEPTAGGWFCGGRRRQGQLAQDRENGIEHPWPYCRVRAGRGTSHVGIGRCDQHAGASPGYERHVRLRLARLVDPALMTLARAMTAEDVAWQQRLTAARDVLDRAGFPRRMEVDAVEDREALADRIDQLVDAYDPDDDADPGYDVDPGEAAEEP